MRRHYWTIVFALVAACGSDASSPSDNGGQQVGRLYRGVAATLTRDPRVPAVAADTDGSRLALLAGPDPGAVLTLPDGRGLTAYTSADGLPERALIELTAFVFANYTATTVDVAWVNPNLDGSVEVRIGVALPKTVVGLVAERMSSPASSASATDAEPTLADQMEAASRIITIASCAAGATDFAPALPACANPILLALKNVAKAGGGDALTRSADALNSVLAASECKDGNASSCLDLLTGAIKNVAEQTEIFLNQRAEKLEKARRELEPVAFVVVSPPSVTLTVGQSAQLFASAQTADGYRLSPGRPVLWGFTPPGVVSLSEPMGPFVSVHAVAAGGPVTVTALIGGQRGSATVTVR